MRTSVRAPGARTSASYTSSSADAGMPFEQRDARSRSDSSKSSSPRIARSVTAATSAWCPL